MIQVSKPSLGNEEASLVSEVLDSGWLGSGKYVTEFENNIADYLGATEVIAVNTGTSALHLALEATGVKANDEVIVPSLTFCASVQAIILCGAKPVFCEVQPDTLCIDPDHIQKLITAKTKVIMPVHYAGISSEMDMILDIGKKRGIPVIEDAAHAFGSSFKSKKLGSFGDITCFSFDPIKNITCGEGGAIVVHNNSAVTSFIHKRRILGISRDGWSRHQAGLYQPYQVTDKGYRYHMSNINAAIGIEQLKKINTFKLRKTDIVKNYNSAFSNIRDISLLNYNPDVFPFIYTVKVKNDKRDSLIKFLEGKGISSAINYFPNHLQPAFCTGVSLALTEKLAGEIISLPLFTDMTDMEVEYVISMVNAFFK